jgi:hypothetical protein
MYFCKITGFCVSQIRAESYFVLQESVSHIFPSWWRGTSHEAHRCKRHRPRKRNVAPVAHSAYSCILLTEILNLRPSTSFCVNCSSWLQCPEAGLSEFFDKVRTDRKEFWHLAVLLAETLSMRLWLSVSSWIAWVKARWHCLGLNLEALYEGKSISKLQMDIELKQTPIHWDTCPIVSQAPENQQHKILWATVGTRRWLPWSGESWSLPLNGLTKFPEDVTVGVDALQVFFKNCWTLPIL